MRRRKVAAVICLALGSLCLFIGIKGLEPVVVMNKAIMICLECIGIG